MQGFHSLRKTLNIAAMVMLSLLPVGRMAASNSVLNDRDAANSIFGNATTASQSPAPPANHFAYPIPIGMGARPEGMG